ncbi:hypothetical protein [Paenibacillus methanolicus]|uniref:Uncharacterized protein n=1 Tax=Paenibacillus methanolicus TaxID=582686 RepID=A0A5S5CDN8_9BACL|nr:hypothetical protein [Paenibacillus methanolicus]TYP76612.1 hypothetical protein BCM02_103274 [Paenibacillus methanolicus]
MTKPYKGAHAFQYMKLNNRNFDATYPVSVDYSFLHDLLQIERSYDQDEVLLFRRNSHPMRKYHVTEMSIRLMMTISRRFNTEGSLSGVSTHQLYQLMNEEYEDAGSKEQFYAEIRKFIDLGLLSTNQNGIISEWRLESFKRRSGRFVLFNPVVFTKAFTDLPVSAQKLYLYIISRNGDKMNAEFKEFLGEASWIYTLTHKNRPAQIRESLQSLATLEPQPGHPLFTKAAVSKDATGRWSLCCVPNPAYQVRHEANRQYRAIPKAKVPYSKTVGRLRMLLRQFRIGDLEQLDNGQTFLKLAQLLHNRGLKVLRFAAKRLRDMFDSRELFSVDPVLVLEKELEDRTYQRFIEITQSTGIYAFIVGEETDYALARPYQFYRAVKGCFSLRQFKTACQLAVQLLRTENVVLGAGAEFYVEEYLISRFARADKQVHA